MPVTKNKKATGKKTTGRRKSTSRVGKSKADSCKAVGSRVKVGQKSFKVASYKSKKTDADKIAENHRAKGKGKFARVKKVSCGGKKTYQVLTYG